MKEALFSVPPGRQIEYICYVNYANLFNIPLFWMFKNLKIYGKKNVVMDGRTDIRSCEYRAKILDLEFSTCIEEKNNDHYSKCSNNHFHYCAHFARSSSSPIPISDFRFAGIAVIFCWSRTCANIPKTKK